MPIFEFHCKECAVEFKTLRKADALSEVSCPDCGGEKVMRLLSVTAQSSSGSLSQSSCETPSAGACSRPGGCCRMN